MDRVVEEQDGRGVAFSAKLVILVYRSHASLPHRLAHPRRIPWPRPFRTRVCWDRVSWVLQPEDRLSRGTLFRARRCPLTRLPAGHPVQSTQRFRRTFLLQKQNQLPTQPISFRSSRRCRAQFLNSRAESSRCDIEPRNGRPLSPTGLAIAKVGHCEVHSGRSMLSVARSISPYSLVTRMSGRCKGRDRSEDGMGGGYEGSPHQTSLRANSR